MKTATKPKPVKMTRSKRLRELQSFVSLCFGMLTDYDNKEICNLSGLSLRTINRLHSLEFSLCIQFKTVQALGIAAGLEISLTPYSSEVRLLP